MQVLRQAYTTYKGLFNYKRSEVITAYKKDLYVYDQDLKKEVFYKVNYYLNIQGYNTFRYDNEEEVIKALDQILKTRQHLKNYYKDFKIKKII
jgi:hypothetical protein